MISNPTSKGKTSEVVILAALVKLGKSVLIPWGEERYDLALDEGGRLVRIQCKTGHIRDGCVCFKTSITDARRPLGDGGYAGQIGAFAVYCPQIQRYTWSLLRQFGQRLGRGYDWSQQRTGKPGTSGGLVSSNSRQAHK